MRRILPPALRVIGIQTTLKSLFIRSDFVKNSIRQYSSRNFDQRRYKESRRSDLGSNLRQRNWLSEDVPPVKNNFYEVSSEVEQLSEKEIATWQAENKIGIRSNGVSECPKPILSFEQGAFPDNVNKAIEALGIKTPTPIQSLGLPIGLSGINMVGVSRTGSGKTLSFILPAINHIMAQDQIYPRQGPIALVIAPTRELAQQVENVSRDILGKKTNLNMASLVGGNSKQTQLRAIEQGLHLVVATPGRLIDLLSSGYLELDRCSYLVLDEADRMLDMGFEPQLRKIMSQIRPDRQVQLYSATWPNEVRRLAEDFLGNNYVNITVGDEDLTANENITQSIRFVNNTYQKISELEQMSSIFGNEENKILIFTKTKAGADHLANNLYHKMRIRTWAIHGDVSQVQREKRLHSFRTGQCRVLVATDVASRGIDINDITHVINFDMPNTIEDYVHRIGRTARGTHGTGEAISFFSHEDARLARSLVDILDKANQHVDPQLRDNMIGNGKKSQTSFGRFNQSVDRGRDRQQSWGYDGERGSSPLRPGRDSRRDLRHERFRDRDDFFGWDDDEDDDFEPEEYWDRQEYKRMPPHGKTRNNYSGSSQQRRPESRGFRQRGDAQWGAWENHKNY